MNRISAATILAAILALAACSTVGDLAGAAPQGVDLAGTWRLNRAASDDLSKLMQKVSGRRHRGPPASEVADADADDLPTVGAEPRERGNERRRARGMGGDFLSEVASGRGLLRIEQRATELVISNGVRSRKLTPGGHSVVSATNGVADQSSGWKGDEFVVETSGRDRPTIVERYSLSADRKQLTVAVKIIGRGQLPNLEFKRIYDAAPDDAEESGPST